MNPDRKPDLDLEVVLAAFKADDEDEATYQLLAAAHDEDKLLTAATDQTSTDLVK